MVNDNDVLNSCFSEEYLSSISAQIQTISIEQQMSPRNANIFKHLITGKYIRGHTWSKHGFTIQIPIMSGVYFEVSEICKNLKLLKLNIKNQLNKRNFKLLKILYMCAWPVFGWKPNFCTCLHYRQKDLKCTRLNSKTMKCNTVTQQNEQLVKWETEMGNVKFCFKFFEMMEKY